MRSWNEFTCEFTYFEGFYIIAFNFANLSCVVGLVRYYSFFMHSMYIHMHTYTNLFLATAQSSHNCKHVKFFSEIKY